MRQHWQRDAALPWPSSMPCLALCTIWVLSKHECAVHPNSPPLQAEARHAQQGKGYSQTT